MTGQAGVNVRCRWCGRVWTYQAAQPGRVYTFACPGCTTPMTFRVGRKGARVIRVLAERETKEAA